MNRKEISLLVIYAIWLQISPWNPSVYGCIVEILKTVINDISLVILYQYYQSIPESKTSFLHYIMKIIVLSLGLTITIRMCGRSLLNLAPETTLDLLYRFPSVICMLYDGYGFANSIMVLITLRALFNAYPHLMFLLEDDHLTLWFWIVNVNHQIDGFVFFYQQSNTMCDNNSIETIRVSLNLHIDESKIGTYGGISKFGEIFLFMPLFAEILSRVVIKWRVCKR